MMGPPLTFTCKARRVQFRLQSAQDCARIVEVLQRRGMEFQMQRTLKSRPGSARPDTAASDMRPLTMQTSAPSSGALAAPTNPSVSTPFQLQPLEAGGLSCQHFRPIANAGDADARLITRMPFAEPNSFTEPHKPTCNVEQAMSVGGLSAPAIPHSRTLQTAADPGHGHAVNAVKTQLVDPSTSVLPSYGERLRHEPMATDPSLPANFNFTTSRQETSSDGMSSSDNYQSFRSSSANASMRMPDTLEHEMPPRRELPFKRPGSHQSTSSRPSTTSNSVRGHAKDKESSDPTTISSILPAAKPNTASRPATAASIKRAVAPGDERPAKKVFSADVRPYTSASTSAPSQETPRPLQRLASTDTSRRPSDLGELIRSRNPLGERSPNAKLVSRVDSTADAQFELDTPPDTSSAVRKPATNSEKPPSVKAHSVNEKPNDWSDKASLAEYASQSREDRQTLLDEFMVSKLEDADFATLCEDLDSCWRRIALGL